MLLGEYHAFRAFRAGVVAARTFLMLRESARDIGRDAGIEGPVRALEYVNDVLQGISTMRAPGPAAGATHSPFQLRYRFFDANASCFRFLTGRNPADPFVAGERSDVFPYRMRLRVSIESFSQVCR
jgi:hypothetical protein